MQVNFQQFPGQGEAAFRIYRKRHGMTQVRNTVGYTENINFRCLEDLQEAGMARVSNFLTLDYCGYEKCAPGYSFGPYVRENFVLHIIFAGKGFLEREDKTYSVRAGQAFIIRPGAQALYRADRDDPWTYRWVGFHGPLCSKIVRNMGFSENEDVITLTDTERFAEYIDAMLDNKELNYSKIGRAHV